MATAPEQRVEVVGAPAALVSRRRLPWLLAVHWDMVRTKPLGTVGLAICLVLLLTGIFAPVIATAEPNATNLRAVLQSPSAEHWFGTDILGRDMYSRVIWGARVSVIVAFSAVGLGVTFALILGTVGGMRGGITDLVIQRLVDAWIAIPWLIFLLVMMTILRPGVSTIIAVLAFGVGMSNSRIVRGAVLQVMAQPYVEAARALGATDVRLMLRHIVPNIMAPVIVIATISLGNVILVEAALSFLGFGIPPPTPAWGRMLSGQAREYMYLAPWLMIFPGLAITLVVFGINMYGDALRDLLDPRLRGSR